MPSGNSTEVAQISRRFFGYALSHDPIELFKQTGRPAPSRLGQHVTSHLVDEAIKNHLFRKEEIEYPGELFAAAMDNTRVVLIQEIRRRKLPLDFVQLIARDERTISSIARLAMHGDGFMQTALAPASIKKYVSLSEDATHITTTKNLVDPVIGGCPFAMLSDRTTAPDPLFRRAVHFASDLTFLAYKNK